MERSEGREMIRCGVSKKDDSLGWIRARPECTMTPSAAECVGLRATLCNFGTLDSLVRHKMWMDDKRCSDLESFDQVAINNMIRQEVR